MFHYNSVQQRTTMKSGKKQTRIQKVVISGTTGYKEVTVMGPKGKRTTKKKLSRSEWRCIKKCQFVPGLFRDCEECLDKS